MHADWFFPGKKDFCSTDDCGAGEILQSVDNAVAHSMHGSKKGGGIVAVHGCHRIFNLGTEVVDAAGRFKHSQGAARSGQVAAVIRSGQATLSQGMGVFQILERGEYIGEMQGVLGGPGNQDVRQGHDDMVFAVAASHRRALAIPGAGLADAVVLFLDSVELADVEGIADSCPTDKRWLGTKMGAQSFDLVDNLLGA